MLFFMAGLWEWQLVSESAVKKKWMHLLLDKIDWLYWLYKAPKTKSSHCCCGGGLYFFFFSEWSVLQWLML